MRQLLLVEDDRELASALRIDLVEEGFAVRSVHNGREALETLSAGFRPELILLDLNMPVMSGWQFRARQLCDPELACIPTVVLTAATHLSVARIDADDIVLKPVRRPALLEAIDRALGAVSIHVDMHWRLAAPAAEESFRWINDAGEWVAVGLGDGAEIGQVIVRSSHGERRAFDDYEEALAFCRALRV
jgi:CheY-like chemotaxis protein